MYLLVLNVWSLSKGISHISSRFYSEFSMLIFLCGPAVPIGRNEQKASIGIVRGVLRLNMCQYLTSLLSSPSG